jgi:mRNA interferase RelE/StbE
MSYQIVIPKPAQKQLDNISKIERDRLILTLRSLAIDPRPNRIPGNSDDIMILLQRHNLDN